MSMITENTVIVKKGAIKTALADLKMTRYADSAKVVYTNNDIAVILFDSNGDPCWEVTPEECKLNGEDILCLETNYLDGEDPYLWKPENKDTINEWIREHISKQDIEKVEKSISYSI